MATGSSTSCGHHLVQCMGCDTHLVSSNDATRAVPLCGWCSGPKCILDFKYDDFCFALLEDDIESGKCNGLELQANACTVDLGCQTSDYADSQHGHVGRLSSAGSDVCQVSQSYISRPSNAFDFCSEN